MADLIAQGQEPQQRWRRALPENEPLALGRSGAAWGVPWDPHVSRRHAELRFDGKTLAVARVAGSRNPIYFRGKAIDRFQVAAGEHFVIGGTSFTFSDQRMSLAADSPLPVQQQTFSSQYLKQVSFRNPDHRIEVLSRLAEVLGGASDDGELCIRLASMLLAGIPRADTAAIVAMESVADRAAGTRCRYDVLHWDQRLVTDRDFQPSGRLLEESLRQGQGVLHVWRGSSPPATQPFTARGNVDWAFCTPVPDAEAATDRGRWILYVAGRFHVELPALAGSSDPTDLREDMKFAELVAGSIGSLRQMRVLQRQRAVWSQFLSPVVLERLSYEDPDVVLAPREADVSVLFCDLRGFSMASERHADDLLELLNRVSKALGVMTRCILDHGGVIGDFQGDAAMGFWGWPLAQPEYVERTCRAALGIRRQFEAAALDSESHLAGFHVGIGIATGRAVAGKIGTVDQVKVTVFGPVVNLASRLEGMTKILRAPILLDEPTAVAVRRGVPRETARVRRLAVVRPYGLDTPLEVSELLPPVSEYPLLTDEHLDYCERALDAFVAGRWAEAYELLHLTPTEDQVTDFLTVYIAQHNRVPPPNWDGVINLSSK
ncbi:MAG: adenylate/guanylate cyclase domain-containing protein [Rhodopirellula sp.]|nr:adenylate/guanylate cyclase domain-containing protein [Rhodopirellula sp.]